MVVACLTQPVPFAFLSSQFLTGNLRNYHDSEYHEVVQSFNLSSKKHTCVPKIALSYRISLFGQICSRHRVSKYQSPVSMLDSLLFRRSLFFTPYPFILVWLRCLSEVPVVQLILKLVLSFFCSRPFVTG